MTSLSRSDMESILTFLGDVSEVASDSPYPIEFLDRLRGLIPSDAIQYSDEDPITGKAFDLVDTGADADVVGFDAYLESGPCPTKAFRHRTGDLCAVRTSDVVSPGRFRESPVYREYFLPNGIEHILDMGLPAEHGHDRSIVLFRDHGARDFSRRDREVLEILRPHLRRMEASAALRRRIEGEGDGVDDPYLLLTPREREVVALVAEGKTNAEIATELWIAPGTVKKHLENVYAKTGVGRRAAVAAGMQRSLR